MKCTSIFAVAILQHLFPTSVSGRTLTTAGQIAQSQVVRVELDPFFTKWSPKTACSYSFVSSLTDQLNIWLEDATQSILGYTLSVPPLQVTWMSNITDRRALIEEGQRNLLFNCNVCSSKACILWCGCRRCSNDDDDVRRLSLRANQRKMNVDEQKGSWYKTGEKTPKPSPSPTTLKPTSTPTTSPFNDKNSGDKSEAVSKYLQRQTRVWAAANDLTQCMGTASKLTVSADFY